MDLNTFNSTIKRWGIDALLAAKAALVHTHVIADTTGLQTALDAKYDDPTGTPTGSKFLRDDNSWQTVPVPSGTVTSVSVTTANGVSGTVATATSTPAISLTLGAITPSSVASAGTVTGSNLSGTNTGDGAVNALYSGLAASKQDTLVSATNIKTVNGTTILGSGDLVVSVTAPNIPLTNAAPSGNETITAGYSAYCSDVYDIADTYQLEVGDGAIMEIG